MRPKELVKSEGHPGAGFGPKALHRLAHNSAPQFQVKLHRPLIVGQRPNKNGRIAMFGKIFSRHFKKTRTETKPLKFRRDIKLKNLSAIMQRRYAVAPITGIAADRLIKIKDKQAGPPSDG